MPPRPQPGRREEILDQVVEYLSAHGVTNASLRDLAEALGVSTYTFSYQFGSKEELLVAVLRHLQRRQADAVLRLVEPGLHILEGARRYWGWATKPENIRFVALSYEVARDRGLPEAERIRVLEHWARAINQGFEAAGVSAARAPYFSSMLAAATGGLLADLAWTGERARVDGAFELFLETVRARLEAEVAGSPETDQARATG